jgi:replication-associated recombination protein RarA
MKTKEAFVAKYAPNDLSDIVYSDALVEEAIQRYAYEGEIRPLILYGPYGTGKSTIARLLARKILPGSTIDIHEFDAEMVCNDPKVGRYISEYARYRGMNESGVKVFLFDEFDLFPSALVRVLKCIMDRAEHVFIATTNEINALDGGHRSRAIRLHIIQAPLKRWMPRIEAIFAAEGVSLPPNEVLQKVLENSKGDNRQFLADLQRICEGLLQAS